MTGEAPIPDATVLIEGDRIIAIGATASAEVPDGTRRINGTGKWIMPGLTDMHIHMMSEPIPEFPYTPADSLAPYLANGVLQVLDLASNEHTNALRDEIAAGASRGPRLATARMVDGDPPQRGEELATGLGTPDAARQAVADIVANGYDFIKVYSGIDLETYTALLEAAAVAGIRVIGHIPGRVPGTVSDITLSEAVLPGLALVSHVEEFAFRVSEQSDAEIADIVALAEATGLGVITTMFLNEQLVAQTRDPAVLVGVEGLAQVDPVALSGWFEANPYVDRASPERIAQLEGIVDFNRRLVTALVAADVPVLAGTDAWIAGLAPGFSLHEELGALARAGLTNEQVLTAATSAPAAWLGVADDRGTVEIGKRANLLILDADPLADLDHTRQIAGIVLDGQLMLKSKLDAMLADLDAKYAPIRPLFSAEADAILDDR
jgi:imidazolonepropionase-like amidohydrolase